MRFFERHGLNLPPQIRVFAGFFLYAFGMGGIFPRIGDIQRALGVNEGTLGFALIGAACGTLISLTLAGRWLERIGYRRAVHVLVPLLPAWYALAAWAPAPWALFVMLVPAGMTIGCIEIIVNLEADRVEHQVGRRIMNRAHAFWSFGFFAAGLVGALMSKLGASPQLHLALMVPVCFVATVLLLGRFDPAPHRDASANGAPPEEAPHFARPTRFIMVLVLVTLPAMMLEGAGAEWSAIYMRDVFAATPFISGFAVALGAFTQAITRFGADAFVERHGPARVSRVLLGVLGVGALLVFSASSAGLSLLGFGLMGVGTSVIFPLAMSAAAQRTDRPAALNVAALAQTAFVIFMVGPPLLGFVAQHFGIRWSFGIGLPLVVVALLLCGALGQRKTG
jgi:MFS family permease